MVGFGMCGSLPRPRSGLLTIGLNRRLWCVYFLCMVGSEYTKIAHWEFASRVYLHDHCAKIAQSSRLLLVLLAASGGER